jgi:DNA-binding helix-hairpin-helix protein with protein kinase domain
MTTGLMVDAKGNAVRLGRELGRGGEGSVFDVRGRPDTVAKVYHSAPKPDHAAKLTAMAAMAEDRLTKIAAWPTGTLHGPSGSVVGFLMPKVGGHRPVFQLYGPKLRMQEFPKADWRFLIHAAANSARAFSTVHATGIVMGDVNHGNLVVGQDGTVRLIDCDSFQVTRGGQTWYCPVGVGTHQPPEMQAVPSYAGVRRTPNHDNFGLAVIIFQLLCIARHPFAGRHLGSGEPPSIEEAIARSRYAYSRERSRTQMAPPPGSLPIDALTPRVQDMFEQAFSPDSAKAGRPTPDHWVSVLQELGSDLRQCSVNQGHHYRKGLPRCPWCDIEAASGTPLFPAVFVTTAGQPGGMLALWQQVTAIAQPRPLPPFPISTGSATPSPVALATGRKARILRLAAHGATAASMGAALVLAPAGWGVVLAAGAGFLSYVVGKDKQGGVLDEYRRRLQDAERDWEALRQAWGQPAKGATHFAQERAKLAELKARHDALPNERAKRLQMLAEHLRQRQLESHLDRFLIADAKISGVGRAKVVTLSAYGIDTAGDVVESRVIAIPGFGPATTAKLVAWRRKHEQTFRFDPSKGVPQSEIAKVERDIAMERNRLETEVATGLARLKAAAAAADNRRRMLEGKAAELQPKLAQARADANAAPGDEAAHKRRLGVSGAVLGLSVLLGLGGHQPSPQVAYAPPAAPAQRVAPHSALTPAATAQQNRPANIAMPASEPARPSQGGPTQPRPEAQPRPSSAIVPAPLLGDAGIRNLAPPLAAEWPQTVGPATAAARDPTERVVTRQGANVREAPNGSANVVRTAPSGAVLRVFGRSSGWVQIGESTPWGWIHSSLLDQSP